jgi:5-methylcytosine-specific restriction endonuclease McrA
MKRPGSRGSSSHLDRVLEEAARARSAREKSYREQALKLYPHVCARCGREFAGERLRELTVHHRDHDHDNNPADGSNWELLCLYCHDAEHQRQLQIGGAPSEPSGPAATHNPFAELGEMIRKRS